MEMERLRQCAVGVDALDAVDCYLLCHVIRTLLGCQYNAVHSLLAILPAQSGIT